MEVKLNAIDVELRVRALARTYPTRVYQQTETVGCSYQPTGVNPLGCVVGAAIGPLGCDLEWWDQYGGIVQSGDFRIDGDTRWLSNVQYRQDQGQTWQRAVEESDRIRAGEHVEVE